MSNCLFGPLVRATAAIFAPAGAIAQTLPATAPATGPAAQPVETLPHAMIALGSIGLVLLTIWILRAAQHPGRLDLRNTPARRNRLHPLHLVAVFLLSTFIPPVVGLVLSRVWGFSLESTDLRDQLLQIQASVLAGPLIALWMGGASIGLGQLLFSHGLVRGMGLSLRHWFIDSLRAIVAFLMVLPVCLILMYVMTWVLSPWPEFTQEHTFLQAATLLTLPWKILAFVAAAVLAPLAEECFFRGLLQSTVRQYTGMPRLAIVVTSALFAMAHWPFANTIPSLFFLALALGYLYERSGRLWSSILLHAIFNAANMLVVLAG